MKTIKELHTEYKLTLRPYKLTRAHLYGATIVGGVHKRE